MRRNKGLKEGKSKFTVMITTMILCVLLLSATTYAWFKLTNSPSVNELTLQAGTEGNLKICKTETGKYGDTLDLSAFVPANACLKPLTTIDGNTFYKPVYSSDGVVTAVEDTAIANLTAIANKTEENGGYIVQTDFYLQATSSVTKEIGIKLAGSGASGTGSDLYTKLSNSTGSDEVAASVRVSFTCGSTTTVLEPNAEIGRASCRERV